MVKIPHRLYLNEDEMPKQWYNMRADMKELPAPMMNPATMQPATEEDLYPVFCKSWRTRNWITRRGMWISRTKCSRCTKFTARRR